jgi:hypothetical protein
MIETSYMGLNGFFWFQGVVEDRQDPKKLGRVRVRIFGIHTEQKKDIPTEELPWAVVAQPTNSTSMNGMGETPSFLVEGTWVMGFFRDGNNCQHPVIFASLPGIPEEVANPDIGFYDPRTDFSKSPRKIKSKKYPNNGTGAVLVEETSGSSYPRTVNPYSNVTEEPDTNRLARNQNITDTIVQVKKDERDKAIKTGLGQGGTWDEPQTSYNPVYPYNHVFESESGHIREVDDTPGAERLHNYHRTGTFEEIHPDGSKVTKIVKNNFQIVLVDDNVHIQGTANLTVDGNINILCKKNVNLEVEKNVLAWVKGDIDAKVDGDVVCTVGGDVDVDITGDLALHVEGNVSANIEGNLVGDVGGNTELHTGEDIALKTDGDVYHSVGGNYTLKVGGNYVNEASGTHKSQSSRQMTLIGNDIHLNP